jgi:hypothetical protein
MQKQNVASAHPSFFVVPFPMFLFPCSMSIFTIEIAKFHSPDSTVESRVYWEENSFSLQAPDPESIRYQVVRMMRMLVTITNTLEKMPEERYIMMKVEYTNDTPAAFGTPNFCDASSSQVAAHFQDAPLVMCDISCNLRTSP